jgi:cysteinyl-tRNA synthetase
MSTPGSKLLNKPIHLTNSKGRKKELFQTMDPGRVKMYSCGPTVYSYIHIGNLRAALTADLFYRFFKYFGYQVEYVRNYTDIDDRIIKKAMDEKVPFLSITEKYIGEVEKDYALAGLEEPTHKTKVTDHLPEITRMIEAIVKNEKGYVAKNGEVFFSIDAFPTYGSLSGKSVDDLLAGARVELNPNKKNPMDFTLWKPAKAGEDAQGLAWDSPWGRGRPGWHIECSAMACKWLGNRMDLHHGGEDLIFPHHENEIAQSEAATKEAPYSMMWVHNAFLNFSSEKMSKSLGNVVNARDFLAEFGGEVARFILLGVHYRAVIDFLPDTVDQAVQSLERIYTAKKLAEEVREKKLAVPDMRAEQVWGGFMIDCDRATTAIQDHYANDLNTAGALSEVFTLLREWNRCAAEPNAINTPTAILAANEFIKVLENDIGQVIGVGRKRASTMLEELQTIRMKRQAREGVNVMTPEAIESLIQQRKDARGSKNFKRSDEIRDELLASGIEIKDSPTGTTWLRK